MATSGLSGAREPSAGDEFHVLWGVHRVLALLDPAIGLERVVMEDLTPILPEGVSPESEWARFRGQSRALVTSC